MTALQITRKRKRRRRWRSSSKETLRFWLLGITICFIGALIVMALWQLGS